jgi:cob(I)alamin adenosyltransferase
MMGWGKGKTTSAIGIAARALGNGEKVLFCQFLKDGNDKGIEFLKQSDNFIHLVQKTQGFKKEEATDFYHKCLQKIKEVKPNFVIFDELNVAMDYQLIKYSNESIMTDLLMINQDIDVYITGRINKHNLRHHMSELADIATNCYCEKHSYNKQCSHCGMEFNTHYNYCPICSKKLKESIKAQVGREC